MSFLFALPVFSFAQEKSQGIEIPATVERERADTTSLQIYFNDGHDKYYKTSPTIYLFDPKTRAVIKTFDRLVDSIGNPIPQKGLLPGIYDMLLSGKKRLIVKGVAIEENKKNIVTINVSFSTLRFEYEGDTVRPVKGFSATVMQRASEGGKIVEQKCTEELAYEPGDYFIEINTLPRMRRNLHVDANSENVIRIPQSGSAIFNFASDASRAYLYCLLGDEYVRFYSVNAKQEKLQLKPGPYEVHFQKNTPFSGSSEKVVKFVIVPNQITEVELK